ncbi:MAG: hypothetical protein IIT36_00410 [Aeriscardovia sp.]|nr:hypothetical protein [Aeriscardovia sp.]
MTDKTIEETMNLDWAVNPATHLWMAFLPTITGYCHPRYVNAAAEVKKQGDSWGFQIDVSIKEDGTAADLVFLTNRDFTIPNGKTAREMKQKVGQLTIPQIKAKLKEKGYEPTYQWTVND